MPNAIVPACADEPGLPGDEQDDGQEVRPAEAFLQERYGEQRDPNHERLLQERRLRRRRAGEALEEEHERDAASDHADAEEREPLPARRAARQPWARHAECG